MFTAQYAFLSHFSGWPSWFYLSSLIFSPLSTHQLCLRIISRVQALLTVTSTTTVEFRQTLLLTCPAAMASSCFSLKVTLVYLSQGGHNDALKVIAFCSHNSCTQSFPGILAQNKMKSFLIFYKAAHDQMKGNLILSSTFIYLVDTANTLWDDTINKLSTCLASGPLDACSLKLSGLCQSYLRTSIF